MNKQENLLIAWLKDAYAMEKSIINILKVHAKEAKNYPEIQEKIKQHMEVTEDQAERIKQRLEEMGQKTSTLKTLSGKFMGKVQAYGTKFDEDKIVKNALAEHATEAFEMGAYEAIKTAAEKLEDGATVELAQSLFNEEREMKDWLEERLPMLIDMFFTEKARKEPLDDDYEEDEDEI